MHNIWPNEQAFFDKHVKVFFQFVQRISIFSTIFFSCSEKTVFLNSLNQNVNEQNLPVKEYFIGTLATPEYCIANTDKSSLIFLN